MTAEIANHICLDEKGIAWIDQTQVKVIEVAMDHVGHGWSAEEIHRQHPTLSLAQSHAALAYYYDHQARFDQAIAESLTRADAMAASDAHSAIRLKARRLSQIPS